MHLPDLHSYWEMLEGLESLFRVEDCSFKTIYVNLDGWQIYAGSKIAEKIETKTRIAAQLYNVDLRQDMGIWQSKGLLLVVASERNDSSPTLPYR